MVTIDQYSSNGTSTTMGNSEVVRLCFAMTGAVMSDIEYPEPQKACREPLFEVNAQKLPARIFAVEMALLVRMTALQTSSDGHREREAIEDALKALRVLQMKKLDYPFW